MMSMTQLITKAVRSLVVQGLGAYFNLWIPPRGLGLLYSPNIMDTDFFRLLNEQGVDFRHEKAPWLGFIYNRSPINALSGRRHEGVVFSKEQRQNNNISDVRGLRFNSHVRTMYSFKFYSNDAATLDRLEEHFIIGPVKFSLTASISIDNETFDIGALVSYGGEDSTVEIGGLRDDKYGLVTTLTKNFYVDYPLVWLAQGPDGALLDTDPLTGDSVYKKIIKEIHAAVFYQETGREPVLLFEETYT